MVPEVPSDPEAARPADDVAARIAAAAHELRTPLNGILGFADLLAATGLSPEQTAYVAAIRRSGAALLGLVDDMLDLGRLEAGRSDHPPEALALGPFLEDVAELLAPRAHAKGLELAVCVSPNLPAVVAADPARLRQVLLNLGGNAVKYTEHGGVALEIEPAEAGRIRFRVRDTGIGIAPADASRIFAAFERVDDDASARDGAGLGLAIARTAVERLGGSIGLTSRLGEGSTFAFDLLLPPLAPPDLSRPLAGRRILFLGEGRVEPGVLIRRLHGLGAEPTMAARVADLEADERFDVVVVDHTSPGDAAARLAEARARFVHPFRAVVLLLPLARPALPGLRAAGFDGHLIAPIRTASLVRTILGDVAEPTATTADRDEPAAAGVLDVLLVDDNEINALLGRALVEHLGHRVRIAGDGPAAIAATEAAVGSGRPFDVVLMDLHMPGMDGFAAIREVARIGGEAGRPPAIVAVTADATAAAAERAFAAGADAVLTKPIDRVRLAQLLAEAAARRLFHLSAALRCG
jgi:CheY-like chemotaxis protein